MSTSNTHTPFSRPGTTTSSSLLLALIALMVTKPDFQTALRAEVRRVLGARRPRLADRSKMPYMEAAILEGLRYMTPAPIPAPHETTKDTTLGDHAIPAGTTVSEHRLLNAFSHTKDVKKWEWSLLAWYSRGSRDHKT